VASTGLILPEQYRAVQTKNDGDNFESCYVQQTDSSVKNCILCNLTAKQIYQQDFKQLSALFYVTVEVLAVPWQG